MRLHRRQRRYLPKIQPSEIILILIEFQSPVSKYKRTLLRRPITQWYIRPFPYLLGAT